MMGGKRWREGREELSEVGISSGINANKKRLPFGNWIRRGVFVIGRKMHESWEKLPKWLSLFVIYRFSWECFLKKLQR
jgi:hypothetical protein